MRAFAAVDGVHPCRYGNGGAIARARYPLLSQQPNERHCRPRRGGYC